jgi:hypothetical protein
MYFYRIALFEMPEASGCIPMTALCNQKLMMRTGELPAKMLQGSCYRIKGWNYKGSGDFVPLSPHNNIKPKKK